MNNIKDNIKACSVMPVHKTEQGWEKTYMFPASFPGFEGHFPGNPILPAIIQLMIARESIIEQTGRNMSISGVTGAKFHKIVTPGVAVTVKWTYREQEDSCIYKCILMAEGIQVSSFNLTMKAQPD
jgi:3-hydroxyacyl-[acyl-carrier-protein] dehydratase